MTNLNERQIVLYNQILDLSSFYTDEPQKQGIYDVKEITFPREKIIASQLNNIIIGIIVLADRITENLSNVETAINNINLKIAALSKNTNNRLDNLEKKIDRLLQNSELQKPLNESFILRELENIKQAVQTIPKDSSMFPNIEPTLEIIKQKISDNTFQIRKNQNIILNTEFNTKRIMEDADAKSKGLNKLTDTIVEHHTELLQNNKFSNMIPEIINQQSKIISLLEQNAGLKGVQGLQSTRFITYHPPDK